MTKKGISKCTGRVDVYDLKGNIVTSNSYKNFHDRRKILEGIYQRYKNRTYYIVYSPNIIIKNNSYGLED